MRHLPLLLLCPGLSEFNTPKRLLELADEAFLAGCSKRQLSAERVNTQLYAKLQLKAALQHTPILAVSTLPKYANGRHL